MHRLIGLHLRRRHVQRGGGGHDEAKRMAQLKRYAHSAGLIGFGLAADGPSLPLCRRLVASIYTFLSPGTLPRRYDSIVTSSCYA